MSNERYLVISYCVFAVVSLGLGALAYRLLAVPFAAIARATAGARAPVLRRALGTSIIMAALVGFLSVSYNLRGCMSYEQVVQDRQYLVQMNQRQLQSTGNWLVVAVFLWCAVVLICLVAQRRAESDPSR